MDFDQIVAGDVVVGGLLLAGGAMPGWCSVEAVRHERAGSVVFRLRRIHDERISEWDVQDERRVTRGDPSAIHSAEEFLGMSVADAKAWAGALGWGFRDHSNGGWFTSEWCKDRINVWSDQHGIVVRASMY